MRITHRNHRITSSKTNTKLRVVCHPKMYEYKQLFVARALLVNSKQDTPDLVVACS